ncbi:MAG: response regulator [Myxococcota bacterium]
MQLVSPRALVVDDDPVRRASVVDALAGAGFEVHAADDVRSALALHLLYAPFQVVVTELHVPGMGGVELVDALSLRQPEVRVLFVSADEVPPILSARRAFLSRPFTREEFLAEVGRLMGR